MFRFLIAVAAFLGFCWYAFTTVEQSDGARYRVKIGQLQEQVGKLAQDRVSVTTERDVIKAKLEEIEAKAKLEEIEAKKQAEATAGETAKDTSASQPAGG